MRIAPIILMLAALAGCETAGPLAEYEWMGGEAALDKMAERAASIRSASGTATLTLRRADGREVRLDTAFAAAPPQSLRMRAWKFDHAVADWTFTPRGVWAWQTEEGGAREPIRGPWTARHGELWPLLLGHVERRAGDRVLETRRGDFELVRGVGDLRAHLVVSRSTLTVRWCEIHSATGEVFHRAELSRYRMIGDVAWPMRVVASRGGELMTIDFDEVTLNEPLADEAFTPPSRAKPMQ